jgi:hypothetical protein
MAVLSICVVFASTSFIGALSTPLANTIIVSFGHTEAETAAIDILHEEIPNAINVDFGGFQYNLLKMRAIGPVIYVGHGNTQGIQNGKTVVSAERMACEVKSCASSEIFIIACNSENIAAHDKSGRVHGFSNFIDAELAALETVIRISVSQRDISTAFRVFDRFMNVAQNKISGNSEVLALPLVLDPGTGGGGSTPPPGPYFSSAELWNAIKIFALGLVFALVGFGLSAAMDKCFASLDGIVSYLGIGPTATTKMQAVFSFVKTFGIAAMKTAVTNVYGGWSNMVGAWLQIAVNVLDDWTSNMSVGEWAIFIGICALEILVIILTAGSEAWVRLLAGIGIAAVTAGTIAIADALDSDGTPCKSLLQACNTYLT